MQAIGSWVQSYLAVYYNNDQDVKNDYELQALLAELISPEGGGLRGIGQDGGVSTFDYLVETASGGAPERPCSDRPALFRRGGWARLCISSRRFWVAMEPSMQHGCTMLTSHGKQKRLAKQKKKKRELARQRAQASHAPPPGSAAAAAEIVRRAVAYPHGPSFLNAGWRDTDELMPKLVTVIVTRVAPSGLFIGGVALVDRTCLGVKDGHVGPPVSERDLKAFLTRMGQSVGGFESCDLLVAQSIVYNAIDYARSLGFAPHRDFPEPLFGPRPERLLETPLARPSCPIYIDGPDDDPARIIAQLKRAVGEGNFRFVVGGLLEGSRLGQFLGEGDEFDDVLEEEEGEEEEDLDEDERVLPEGRATPTGAPRTLP